MKATWDFEVYLSQLLVSSYSEQIYNGYINRERTIPLVTLDADCLH